MKKLLSLSAGLLFMASTITSCYVNTFNVGKGTQTSTETKKWNHYVIGGLVPVNVSNPNDIAKGSPDYTVTIYHSFVNMLLTGVTFGIYAPTTTIVSK